MKKLYKLPKNFKKEFTFKDLSEWVKENGLDDNSIIEMNHDQESRFRNLLLLNTKDTGLLVFEGIPIFIK